MKKTINYSMSVIALSTLIAGAVTVASAAALYRDLYVGTTGSDVRDLQTFLASDPTIYPQGTVSGYFGFLTKSAVSNFQARNGISPIGRVGPQTRGVINNQMAGGNNTGGTTQTRTISNVNISLGNTGTTISWNTSSSARGMIYYNVNPLSLYENENSVTVTGASSASTDSNLNINQSVAITGLQPNTTYYYMIYSTDSSGNVSVSAPSSFRTNQ